MATVQKAVADAEKRLLNIGRLLIRKSGTEPLIRVMAEGEDSQLITDVVDELVDTISRTQIA
jgi:phosphoglucosamine mutase